MFVTWRKKKEKENTIKSLIFIKKQKSDRLKQLVFGDAPNLQSKWLSAASKTPRCQKFFFLCDFIFVQKRAPFLLAGDYAQQTK